MSLIKSVTFTIIYLTCLYSILQCEETPKTTLDCVMIHAKMEKQGKTPSIVHFLTSLHKKSVLIGTATIIRSYWAISLGSLFYEDLNSSSYNLTHYDIGHTIQDIHLHPGFNKSSNQFNVALLKVTDPFCIIPDLLPEIGLLPLNVSDGLHLCAVIRRDTQFNDDPLDPLSEASSMAVAESDCARLLYEDGPPPKTLPPIICYIMDENLCDVDVGIPIVCNKSNEITGLAAPPPGNGTKVTCNKLMRDLDRRPLYIVDVALTSVWIEQLIAPPFPTEDLKKQDSGYQANTIKAENNKNISL